MSQDEIWMQHYNEYVSFLKTNKKRPSKHHKEDFQLFNWFKHHKKVYLSGRMPFDRMIIFRHLLELAEDYRKINQHAYVYDEKQKENTPAQRLKVADNPKDLFE